MPPSTVSRRNAPPFYKNAFWFFLLSMGVTVLAFMPSYFTRLTATDGPHHFHGITAMSWLLLLIVQPLLYRLGRTRWHRILGRTSFILVPLIVISSLMMIRAMISGKANYPPMIPYQLAFIDFFTIGLFIYFFFQAIRYRRNVQLHARYMVCTVIGPLTPALTRLLFSVPSIDSFTKSLNLSFIIAELILVILIADDHRSGKIRNVYPIALALFIVQHAAMNFASGWVWWRNLVDAFCSC